MAYMPEGSRRFVHLHCHSHYSLLDGASEIGALVKRAKEHGMNGLALTDHGNLHGALEFYRNLFGERYFIEIMNNGVEVQRMQLEAAVDLAKKLGIPLVATSDAHYVQREDAVAQDVLLCINTGKFRTDTNRMRMENDSFYLRAPEEMYAHFSGLEDAVGRSQELADSVSIDLELGKRHFPTFQLPADRTAEDYLRELCVSGLKERYAGDEEMLPGGQLSQVIQ